MIKIYALILLALSSGNAPPAARRADSADNIPPLVRDYQDAQQDARCERPKENYLEVENTRMRYIEAGDGPAVVLIHGNAGSADEFDFNSLGLLCRDHRVIAIDRPGHGKSERPEGSAATLLDQTRLVRETISRLGITRPVLVGHSWGGSLALAYAVQYPQELSAIVLLAPAAYPDGGGNQFMRAMLDTPVIGDVTLTVGRVFFGKHLLKNELERAFHPEDVPDEYLRRASSAWLQHSQLRHILQDEFSLNKDLAKTSKQYPDIRIPVIIVTGDHDKVVSAKDNAYRLKTSIAQSQLIELKNTGHQVPQTHPECIRDALNLIPTSTAQRRQPGRPAAPVLR